MTRLVVSTVPRSTRHSANHSTQLCWPNGFGPSSVEKNNWPETIDELSGERSVETTDGSTAGSRYQTDERQASTIDPCRFFRFSRDSAFEIKLAFLRENSQRIIQIIRLELPSRRALGSDPLRGTNNLALRFRPTPRPPSAPARCPGATGPTVLRRT